MKSILKDIKIMAIIIICTIIYPILITGKVKIIDTINTLLIITFAICFSTTIIIYYSNKKYLDNLYKSLSVSFLGMGITLLTFINVIKNGFGSGDFWVHATIFNTILSIFESLLFLFSIHTYNKKIKYNVYLLTTVILSLFISFLGANYVLTIEKRFNPEIFEMLRYYGRTFALLLKLILLFSVLKKREYFKKSVYKNFIIFTTLRILLHVCGFLGHSNVGLGVVYLCCCLITIANYYIVKIMVIEIVTNPQEYLCEQLINKTIKLQDTIKELTKVNNQKEIIQNNYNKKTYEDKIKSGILANLSHEFKTPVNVIYAAVQTEQLNKDKLNIEDITKYNSIIKQNCNRLIRIINNFIDVNEFENENRVLNLKYYNIVYITESVVDSVIPYAENKNLSIVFDTSDEVLCCKLDLDLFERAILNLLSNAIKYTNIKSQITVTVEKVHNDIRICIEDHGIGISEEYLNIIFNRFERVDKTFSRDTEGIGLGLNIAKEIIELHKGTITISSKKQLGTKVIVTFPGDFSTEEQKCEDINIDITEFAKVKAAIEMSDIYFN